jgi:hypothetical protein
MSQSAFNLNVKDVIHSKDAFQEGVRKALLSTDFSTNGAVLPAEQASEWITLVRGQSTFLDQHARFIEVGKNLAGELPREHLGEPITIAGSETETATESTTTSPNYDKVSYSCAKLKVRRHISMDALYTAAIGADSLEEALINGIKSRAGVDKELLAFNGDATAYAAINTPMGYLLRANNGWYNLAQRARIIDAQGANLSTNLLYAALDEFPDESWTEDVRWIGNKSIKRDFTRLAAAKTGGDVLADVYFGKEGQAIDYNMIEAAYINVPAVPRNLTVSTTVATPAQVISRRRGPFQIGSTNNKMNINVNAGGVRTVTFTSGLRYASDLAADINAVFATNSDAALAQDWDGYLLISTNATGVATSIAFTSIANSIYLTVTPAAAGGGIVVGTVNGTDAGVAGNQYEGSYLMLCDPRNLIYVQSNQIRMKWEWDDETDAMRFVLFEYVDFAIEDPQSLVLIKNLRKQR